MQIPVDVWLRGSDVATTSSIDGIARAPRDWLDEDVRLVLEEMLRAIYLRAPSAIQHNFALESFIELPRSRWIRSTSGSGT